MTARLLRAARGAALTLAAAAGVMCVLSVLAGLTLGVRPLVVQSGSMSPAIETGALAWARQAPAADLAVGDVVMVDTADGDRVTHRIVAIDRTTGTTGLTLQGDANGVPDPVVYPVDHAYRVFADIPHGGRVVAWLSGPVGIFVLGMFAMGMIFLLLRPGRDDDPAPPDCRSSGGRRRAGRRPVRAGAAGMVVLSVVGVATPSWAAFTDTVTVAGSTLGTHTVQPPDSVSCSVSGNTVTFAWPEKDARYDYEIALQRETSPSSVLSTSDVTGTAVSRQFTSPDAFGLSGSLLGISQSFYFRAEVRSWLSGTTAPNRWQSSSVRFSTQRIRINVNCLLVLACTVSAPTCVV